MTTPKDYTTAPGTPSPEATTRLQSAPGTMSAKLQQRVDAIKRAAEFRQAETVQPLPMWPEQVRGTPNAFLRSALFPAIQPNARGYLKAQLLAAPDGVEIRFTGWQLSQSDLQVWQEAVHLARLHSGDNVSVFSGRYFLRRLGREDGKSQHEWLKDCIRRLIACAVEMKVRGVTYLGGLIHSAEWDVSHQVYVLVLNEQLMSLYEDGYTGINLAVRRAIGHKRHLAQWLFSYYSSHKIPYPVKVQTLHHLSGSSTASLKAYRQNLRAALKTLQDAGFITAWAIDRRDLVTVKRA